MKVPAIVAIAVGVQLALLPLVSASGDDSRTHTEAGQTQFTVSAAGGSAESVGIVGTGDQPIDPIVTTISAPICALGGAQTCSETANCDNGDPMTYTTYVTASGSVLTGSNNCPKESIEPEPEPVVTPGLVLAAFRRIALPASELVVQPPGGRTLVNFETNFYTDNGEFTRTVSLLGQRVELRIWPSAFGWRFGDGDTKQTAEAGSPYPDLEITHRYLSKGQVSPSVDTTYAAQFRVNGGPWRDVDGTVTIPGAPQDLRVVTARPVLVGY
jgi:hypothetical protein